MSNLEPGYYDDGSGTQRWWDGSAWTDHTAPANGHASTGMKFPKISKKTALVGGAVAAIAAIIVTLVVVLTGGDAAADTVKKYAHARSCDELHRLVTDDVWNDDYDSSSDSYCNDSDVSDRASRIEGVTIESSKTKGNTARVVATVRTRSSESNEVYSNVSIINLVKVNGDWKVDHFNDDSSDH